MSRQFKINLIEYNDECLQGPSMLVNLNTFLNVSLQNISVRRLKPNRTQVGVAASKCCFLKTKLMKQKSIRLTFDKNSFNRQIFCFLMLKRNLMASFSTYFQNATFKSMAAIMFVFNTLNSKMHLLLRFPSFLLTHSFSTSSIFNNPNVPSLLATFQASLKLLAYSFLFPCYYLYSMYIVHISKSYIFTI